MVSGLLLLKQLIESVVREAAVSVEQAAGSGLALFISDMDDWKFIILYDPTKVLALAKNSKTLLNASQETSPVVGYLGIKADYNCNYWIAKNAAATSGYGPMLYKIAMSVIYPDGLTSDKESVTPAARNLWRQTMERSGEYTKSPILARGCDFQQGHPDIEIAEKDDPRFVPEEALNYTFSIVKKANFVPLIKKHKETQAAVKNIKGFETILRALGMQFFNRKYNGPQQ